MRGQDKHIVPQGDDVELTNNNHQEKHHSYIKKKLGSDVFP